MLGTDRLVGIAIAQTELPATDVAGHQGDSAELLAACALLLADLVKEAA